MPRIAYKSAKKFTRPTLELMERADAIATDYALRGFGLSLRQLFYQLVTENAFPNSERSYQRLIRIVSDARLAGVMDWHHIEDRGRTAHHTSWAGHQPSDQEEIIRQAKWNYALDLWEGQDVRPEVWVEKQALEEVAQKATSGFRVGYFACKGYVSQSELWAAGQRMRKTFVEHGQRPLVLHLGDHDPSGIDMTRDIRERLELFSGMRIEVRRLALNMEQIDELNPPPNPAKQTDSRFLDYAAEYGTRSWELDAIRPEALVSLIRDELHAIIDPEPFNHQVERENGERAMFDVIADRWDEVIDYLGLGED
jgi:hypothetical protein